jgi:hypothetical protein
MNVGPDKLMVYKLDISLGINLNTRLREHLGLGQSLSKNKLEQEQ